MNDLMKLSSLFVFFGAFITASWAQEAPQFELPLDCLFGEDCFLQQMPDMDLSVGVQDPFCNNATYDGHKGTDFRIRYFEDIAKNVRVIASADGKVLRLRDGVEDKIVQTDKDRARVENIECGNGVVVDHGNGWQSQYCHLKNGSIVVNEGDMIKAGDTLGAVGSSGMSQFPHIQISITKNNKPIDPFTSLVLGGSCNRQAETKNDLWAASEIVQAGRESTQILDLGFADGVVDHDDLIWAPPKSPTVNSDAFVGWASLINLREGDVMTLTIIAPDGSVFTQNTIEPLDRSKATYSFYGGKRGAPKSGTYTLDVSVERGGETILGESKQIEIR